MTRLFDLILCPARNAAPAWGIAVAALLTAAGVLFAYRLVSDQGAIRRTKKRIQGYLLGIYLYRDDPAVMLGALARVWWNSLSYMGRAMVPLAVAIIPVALACVQLDLRYAHRPLQPGESAILYVEINPGAARPAVLAVTGGLKIETPSVMIGTGEMDWRIRAVKEGAQAVTVTVGSESVVMPVAVGGAVRALCRERVQSPLQQGLLCPSHQPIAVGNAVRAVRLEYPSRRISLAGMRLHWSIAYFILALVFGLLLKRLFRVEF